MKVEVPEIRRCCCCIPLRHGIITWGYIKLVISVLFTTFMVSILIPEIKYAKYYPEYTVSASEMSLKALFLLLCITDICFNIVFIVGGHRKLPKLLHIYYIYSIVFMCIFIILFIINIVFELETLMKYLTMYPAVTSRILRNLKVQLVIEIAITGFQTYLILLIRSEVLKLRNRSEYRISNLTGDVDCAVENRAIEEGPHRVTAPETSTE